MLDPIVAPMRMKNSPWDMSSQIERRARFGNTIILARSGGTRTLRDRDVVPMPTGI
jgi:hypothetical protein